MSSARYDCFISRSEGDREGTHSNQRYGRICQILEQILIISICSELYLKFIYSEKATKFRKISTIDLTVTT